MDFLDKLRSNAVDNIIEVDGWCEKLPDANCKVCPLACLITDNNEEIIRKADEWKAELSIRLQSQEEAKA